MSHVAVIRQRPGIGDCLLLSPLIREIRKKHKDSRVVVLTDGAYCNGALVSVFNGIPGVDRVESEPFHLTMTPGYSYPHSVQKATHLYNCNHAFLQYEATTNWKPKLSIAEFWLQNFGLSSEHCLPEFHVQKRDKTLPENTIGIVLRAGHIKRDWLWRKHLLTLVNKLDNLGYRALTFDTTESEEAVAPGITHQPLDVVAHLISQLKLLITPDTGLLHLAQAVGTPTVALWGIMPPELRTKGYSTTIVHAPVGKKTPGCLCCAEPQNWACVQQITPRMIIQGVKAALNVPRPINA